MRNSIPPSSRATSVNGRPGTSLVDLSHDIISGSTAYPGLPEPMLTDYISREKSREMYAPGTEFHTGRLCLVGQTGTYLDVPFHRYADGYDLTRLDLRQVVDIPVTVVDVTTKEITAEELMRNNIRGYAVLIRTGWSKFWRTELYSNGQHPHLSGEAARFLAQEGPTLVGIDSLNIDGTYTTERPAHSELLGAGIPIVEHLTNLHQLPDKGARFTAVPVKVAGLGTFPVRAFATWKRWM